MWISRFAEIATLIRLKEKIKRRASAPGNAGEKLTSREERRDRNAACSAGLRPKICFAENEIDSTHAGETPARAKISQEWQTGYLAGVGEVVEVEPSTFVEDGV